MARVECGKAQRWNGRQRVRESDKDREIERECGTAEGAEKVRVNESKNNAKQVGTHCKT